MGGYRIAVIPKNFKQVSAQDLEIDSGTLSVDATNNRVGVNTAPVPPRASHGLKRPFDVKRVLGLPQVG